jgi:hypothetical protein
VAGEKQEWKAGLGAGLDEFVANYDDMYGATLLDKFRVVKRLRKKLQREPTPDEAKNELTKS